MITAEQKEAGEAIEQIKMLIITEAEKAFQKFDILTKNEDLRNAMVSYMCLNMNSFCFPENPRTIEAIGIVEENLIQYMSEEKK